MSLPSVDLGKTFEKINLESSFLAFGGLGILISIYTNHLLGLKVSFLTLIFGGIFRLFNIISKNILSAIPKKVEYGGFIFVTILRFLMWAFLLAIYTFILNRYLSII